MKEDIQGFDIRDASAAVIGCGGLGCNTIIHLAGSGIGQMSLCDLDTVSESNLNRQFFYTRDNTGQLKVDAAARFLNSYSPDVKIETHNIKIEKAEDLEWAKGADIIISAVDNQKARQAINDFCIKNSIPGICGVINGFYGMSYLYIPGESPCFRCAGLTDPDIPGDSVSSAAGVVGAQMSSLAIKFLLDKKTAKPLAGRLYIYDNEEIHSLKIFSEGCTCMENEL